MNRETLPLQEYVSRRYFFSIYVVLWLFKYVKKFVHGRQPLQYVLAHEERNIRLFVIYFSEVENKPNNITTTEKKTIV